MHFLIKSFDSLNDAERKEVLDYITEITKNHYLTILE